MQKILIALLLSFLTSPLIANAKSYTEASNSINIVRSQIGQKTGVITKLLEDREGSKDPIKITELSKEISKEYAALADLNRQLNVKIDELKLQYPEKTDSEDRAYERSKIPTIEDLELGLGVDRQLDDLKAKVKRQYPKGEEKAAVVAKDPEDGERKPSSILTPEEKEALNKKKDIEKYPESERIKISK